MNGISAYFTPSLWSQWCRIPGARKWASLTPVHSPVRVHSWSRENLIFCQCPFLFLFCPYLVGHKSQNCPRNDLLLNRNSFASDKIIGTVDSIRTDGHLSVHACVRMSAKLTMYQLEYEPKISRSRENRKPGHQSSACLIMRAFDQPAVSFWRNLSVCDMRIFWKIESCANSVILLLQRLWHTDCIQILRHGRKFQQPEFYLTIIWIVDLFWLHDKSYYFDSNGPTLVARHEGFVYRLFTIRHALRRIYDVLLNRGKNHLFISAECFWAPEEKNFSTDKAHELCVPALNWRICAGGNDWLCPLVSVKRRITVSQWFITHCRICFCLLDRKKSWPTRNAPKSFCFALTWRRIITYVICS